MGNLLKGKRGIIFGALDNKSIAWKVAEEVYNEGGRFTLTNAPVALRMGNINELAKNCKAKIISADATNLEELEFLIKESVDILGGKLDFILHSIGMSVNVRKKKDYSDLNYEYLMKGLDVSGISFHKLLQTAKKLDAMNEWASILALTFIAAQRTFPEYNDMAESKALLESIARSFGYYYGTENNVRVNTISQSPTITTAGSGVEGFNSFFNYAEEMSPLGNASGEDCAKYIVIMFSDYTRKVTMQNLFHDGGFSSVGISKNVMNKFIK